MTEAAYDKVSAALAEQPCATWQRIPASYLLWAEEADSRDYRWIYLLSAPLLPFYPKLSLAITIAIWAVWTTLHNMYTPVEDEVYTFPCCVPGQIEHAKRQTLPTPPVLTHRFTSARFAFTIGLTLNKVILLLSLIFELLDPAPNYTGQSWYFQLASVLFSAGNIATNYLWTASNWIGVVEYITSCVYDIPIFIWHDPHRRERLARADPLRAVTDYDYTPRRRECAFDHLRRAFRRHPLESPATKMPGHSHAQCAADRNAASSTIDRFALSMGLQTYTLQPSAADLKHGARGAHIHLTPKHTTRPCFDDTVYAGDLIKMVDVDYHIDFNYFMWMQLPIMMYTFTPVDPCGTANEMQWTVDEANVFTVEVSGGARYRHQLYSYEVEFVGHVYDGWEYLYNVDRRRLTDTHSLVLLTPICRQPLVGRPTLNPLRLFRPVQSVTVIAEPNGPPRNVAVIKVQDDDTTYISTAIPGSYTSARYSTDMVDHIRARQRAANTFGRELTLHDMNQIVPRYYVDEKGMPLAQAGKVAAFAMLTLPTSDLPRKIARTSCVTDQTAKSYVRVMDRDEDLGKPSGRIVGPVILNDSYLPSKSRGNDVHCIDGRITQMSNDKDIPANYLPWVREFIAAMTTPLVRLDNQELVDAQSRPTQRRNNEDAALNLLFELPDEKVQSFQKSEAYTSIKDPRNISTVSPNLQYEFGTYTYPYAAWLKTQQWYAFGLNPVEVGERVQSVANRSKWIIETDFTRFDGTHSLGLYIVERAIMLGCYQQHQAEIIRMYERFLTAKATTKFGVSYDIGGSRLSGSPDTTTMNTTNVRCVLYVTARASGQTHDEAMNAAVLLGGDDGVAGDVDPDVLEAVCTAFGLRIKAKMRPANLPLGFLGRVWSDPQTSSESIADIVRQASKLGVTTDMQYPVNVVMVNKAQGILVTDSRTPLLGNWARAVMRVYGEAREVAQLRSWASRSGPMVWPTLRDADALEAEVLRQLNDYSPVELQELQAYCARLDRVTTLQEFNDMPPLIPAGPVDLPPNTVLGDNVHGTPPVGYSREQAARLGIMQHPSQDDARASTSSPGLANLPRSAVRRSDNAARDPKLSMPKPGRKIKKADIPDPEPVAPRSPRAVRAPKPVLKSGDPGWRPPRSRTPRNKRN